MEPLISKGTLAEFEDFEEEKKEESDSQIQSSKNYRRIKIKKNSPQNRYNDYQCCSIYLWILLIISTISFILILRYQNFYKYIAPWDSNGVHCGYANTSKISNLSQKYQKSFREVDFTEFSFLYFPLTSENLTSSNKISSYCIEKCPIINEIPSSYQGPLLPSKYTTHTFGSYCFASLHNFSNNEIESLDKIMRKQIFENENFLLYFYQFLLIYKALFCSVILSLFFIIIFIIFTKLSSFFSFYSFVFLTIIILGYQGVYLIIISSDNLEADSTDNLLWGIIILSFNVIFFLSVIYCHKKIQYQIKSFAFLSIFIKEQFWILIVQFFYVMIAFVIFILFLCILLCITSIGEIIQYNDSPISYSEWEGIKTLFLIISLYFFLWVEVYIYCCSKCMISHVSGYWILNGFTNSKYSFKDGFNYLITNIKILNNAATSILFLYLFHYPVGIVIHIYKIMNHFFSVRTDCFSCNVDSDFEYIERVLRSIRKFWFVYIIYNYSQVAYGDQVSHYFFLTRNRDKPISKSYYFIEMFKYIISIIIGSIVGFCLIIVLEWVNSFNNKLYEHYIIFISGFVIGYFTSLYIFVIYEITYNSLFLKILENFSEIPLIRQSANKFEMMKSMFDKIIILNFF